MAIASYADLTSKEKREIRYQKGNSFIGSVFYPWAAASFTGNGDPAAGSLTPSNTANGILPTDTMFGFPAIATFGSSKGYLYGASLDIHSTTYPGIIGRLKVVDVLWWAGAFANSANQTFTSQPSYSGRIPGGTDYSGLEIWVQHTSTVGGNLGVNVTYTDQAGNTGHSTGTVTFATGLNGGAGNMWQVPLNSGDSGVQKIESVVGNSVGGGFNLLVVRPLLVLPMRTLRPPPPLSLFRTGLVEIYDTSALLYMTQSNQNNSLSLEVILKLAVG